MQTAPQWHDPQPQVFTVAARAHTTLLFGGLTAMHDALIEAALSSLGYSARALPCPDRDALQCGKEFGNRGQCNPTYFTVGNLIKYLIHLRDVEELSREQIVTDYLFVTAGACGPCRFGMYVTEYRKALRDAGFEGFRVLLFESAGRPQQCESDAGLALTTGFFITLLKTAMLGDIVNAMGYRIRPYELVAGSTDAALTQCRTLLCAALLKRRGLRRALRQCRRRLAAVPVNRLQVKPKVSIIGEFWAMTTEGEGNYQLQRFLETEGAECEVQAVVSWVLYILWELAYDTRERMLLRNEQPVGRARWEFAPLWRLLLLRLGRVVLQRCFYRYARHIGLAGYHLLDMEELARISHDYYANELRGGEGHMEVAKLIQGVTQHKVHLTLSIKPFGCMPSSGVSDGVQSLVTARYPEANFLAVETTGDGAIIAHSRVQMALFRARQKAEDEYQAALHTTSIDRGQATTRLAARRRSCQATHYPPHRVAGTAANLLYELAQRPWPQWLAGMRLLKHIRPV
ncbi:MAG: hypothetical protein BMS9Abin30_0115 [Gammaproteobacteria bacterium]|nr:MAG: hypothetical protein BMS9Abin30_0115 [Gammaproteobacteria bacterium]